MRFLALFVALATVLVYAQPSVHFEPSLVKAHPGEVLELSIIVDPGGLGVSAGEFRVSYPSGVFEVLEVMPGSFFGNEPVVGLKAVEDGLIKLAVARRGVTVKPTPKGTGLIIAFKVVEGAASGEYEVKLVKVDLVDESFNRIKDVKVVGGCKVVVEEAPSRGCLVATAAFSTELAGPVQFLRSFRDEVVMNTFTGRCFMEVFNAWYYSWSPYVARVEREYEPLRQMIKYMIYPLIGVLHVAVAAYKPLSFNSELAIIVVGLIASSLISLVYFTPLVSLSLMIMHKSIKHGYIKASVYTWLLSLLTTCLGAAFHLTLLAHAATALLVLATIALTVLLVTKALELTKAYLKYT